MSGFGVLLLRELRRRLPIHVVALAVGLIILVVPWLPGIPYSDQAMVRGAGAVGAAALTAMAVSLLEGITFLCSDLRERRMAFDFRLPVSATSIWAARLVAAGLSLAGSATFTLAIPALAPADLQGGFAGLVQLLTRDSGIEMTSPVLAAVLALLSILLVFNVIGLAGASRSRWLVLDLVAMGAFVVLAWLSVLALWRLGAQRATGRAMLFAIGLAAFSFLVASWLQVIRGRTEADRAHRAFSPAFALLAVLSICLLFGCTRWFVSPTAASLVQPVRLAMPLSNELVWLGGETQHRKGLEFRFLLEPASGRSLRVGNLSFVFGLDDPRGKRSADGTTLAWIEMERHAKDRWSPRLRYLLASGLEGEIGDSPIVWGRQPRSWGLSRDGSKVASIVESGSGWAPVRLMIEDLRSAQTLRNISLPNCYAASSPTFLTEEVIVIGCGCRSPGSDTGGGTALEVDLASESWRYLEEEPLCGFPLDRRLAAETGRRYEPPTRNREGPLRAAGRLLGAENRAIELSLSPELPDYAAPSAARFLADGRLVILWPTRAGALATVFETSGHLGRTFELRHRVWEVLAEAVGGSLLLFGESAFGNLRSSILLRLDLETGESRELARDLRALRPESAATPTTLFLDNADQLLWFDLNQASLTPLLPGR